MQYLKTYLKTISSRGNEKLQSRFRIQLRMSGTVTSRVFHFAVMRLDCFLEMFSLEKQVRCLALFQKQQI